LVTLERIECNAACDYAPVVMTNWEFFDNQTPESVDPRSSMTCAQARTSRPTRGPAKVCTFKEVSRVLAGFQRWSRRRGCGRWAQQLSSDSRSPKNVDGRPRKPAAAEGGDTTPDATAGSAGAAPGSTVMSTASADRPGGLKGK
jgi:NADH-quinone oxidoreductase subunit E